MIFFSFLFCVIGIEKATARRNGLELIAINLAFIVKVVQSQWVQLEMIPDQVLALSSDGSTAIALTGIYRKSGNS